MLRENLVDELEIGKIEGNTEMIDLFSKKLNNKDNYHK
jgi:hypothetical protein